MGATKNLYRNASSLPRGTVAVIQPPPFAALRPRLKRHLTH